MLIAFEVKQPDRLAPCKIVGWKLGIPPEIGIADLIQERVVVNTIWPHATWLGD